MQIYATSLPCFPLPKHAAFISVQCPSITQLAHQHYPGDITFKFLAALAQVSRNYKSKSLIMKKLLRHLSLMKCLPHILLACCFRLRAADCYRGCSSSRRPQYFLSIKSILSPIYSDHFVFSFNLLFYSYPTNCSIFWKLSKKHGIVNSIQFTIKSINLLLFLFYFFTFK